MKLKFIEMLSQSHDLVLPYKVAVGKIKVTTQHFWTQIILCRDCFWFREVDLVWDLQLSDTKTR